MYFEANSLARLNASSFSSLGLWQSLFTITFAFVVSIFFLIAAIAISIGGYESCQASQGKVKIKCFQSEFEDQNYRTVLEQLKALGFTDIELIDLNDGGLFNYREDLVKSVSIGGNSNFLPTDWFYTTDKVIISYY